MGSVGLAIDRGRGEDGLIEELGPLVEGPVRRQNRGAAPVAAVDHLVEILRGRWPHGLEAEVIEDQDIGAHDGSTQPIKMGALQPVRPESALGQLWGCYYGVGAGAGQGNTSVQVSCKRKPFCELFGRGERAREALSQALHLACLYMTQTNLSCIPRCTRDSRRGDKAFGTGV